MKRVVRSITGLTFVSFSEISTTAKPNKKNGISQTCLKQEVAE